MPTKQDLFGGSRRGVSWDREYRTSTDLTKAFEEYLNGGDGLAKAISRADEGRDYFSGQGKIAKGVRPPKGWEDTRRANLDALEQLTKSVGSEQLAQMSAQIETMRESLVKDWDASFPETGSLTGAPFQAQLAPIDLEGPAKLLVPRETPILNAMPRENDGIGSALQYRRILGWSNSGVGGVPDLMPFMASEFPAAQSTANLPVFGGYANTTGGITSGGLGLRRGQKITYKADAQNIAYTELSLSDTVSTKAYYIGQGYQDVRQLSATALLWAHKGGEERAMLYGRGSGTGYTGAIAAPTAFVAANVVTANTGGTIPNGTYSVMLTAIGGGGESAPSAVATGGTAITGSSVGTVTITFPPMPSGGLGWNIWMLNAATGPFFFQAQVPNGNVNYVLTSYNAAGPTTANGSVVDTTANPNGYDGLLTVLMNPAVSGYVATYVSSLVAANIKNSVGGALAGTGGTTVACGDTPWQTAFQALFGSSTMPGNYGMNSGAPAWPWITGTAYGQKLLARPQVVYVDGTIRAAMGQFVRTAAGGSTAYRIEVQETNAQGGMQVGAIVNGIANQVTGDMVDFEVHPYMPPGNSVIWTKQLPFPDSEITNTIVAKNVQDYLYQMWPQIQFTFDASTYQLGTLVFYAPAWSGAITGLLP
jgi:hypothetical protein